jgi:hypothetical protein
MRTKRTLTQILHLKNITMWKKVEIKSEYFSLYLQIFLHKNAYSSENTKENFFCLLSESFETTM